MLAGESEPSGTSFLVLFLKKNSLYAADFDAVPIGERLVGPMIEHGVAGKEAAEQGSGEGVRGAVAAVHHFYGEAQAQGGKGAGVNALGAGFDKGGFA
jgi:hypothetical protein